jgi:predicted metal-dependent hydrolase
MTRKWASCSPGGVVTFSLDLLEQPRDLGEAVIVHELLHLKVPNHGPVFRSLMRAYLPSTDVATNALGKNHEWEAQPS